MIEDPEDAGWRSVTEETVPVPDKMQTALGLCWENDNSFETISYKEQCNRFQINMKLGNYATSYVQKNVCVSMHLHTKFLHWHAIFVFNKLFNYYVQLNHSHTGQNTNLQKHWKLQCQGKYPNIVISTSPQVLENLMHSIPAMLRLDSFIFWKVQKQPEKCVSWRKTIQVHLHIGQHRLAQTLRKLQCQGQLS